MFEAVSRDIFILFQTFLVHFLLRLSLAPFHPIGYRILG